MHTAYDVVESSAMEAEQQDFTRSYNTFLPKLLLARPVIQPLVSEADWMTPQNRRQFNLVSTCGGKETKQKIPLQILHIGLVLTGGFLAMTAGLLALFRDE